MPSEITLTQSQQGVKKYSTRDTESVSSRSLLANALDSVVQDESEKRRLAEYREAIGKLEGYEKHLAELKEQIRELSFGKGPRDMAKIRALKDEAIKTSNRIGIYTMKQNFVKWIKVVGIRAWRNKWPPWMRSRGVFYVDQYQPRINPVSTPGKS